MPVWPSPTRPPLRPSPKSPPRPSYSNGVVTADNTTYTFSTEDGTLRSVTVDGKEIKFGNGPKFFAYRRADRSWDQFYNHDDPQAEKKKTTYTEYPDFGTFSGITATEGANDTLVVTATYDQIGRAHV